MKGDVFEKKGDLLLNKIDLGVLILSSDLSFSKFFPTADVTEQGVFLIVDGNKKLPEKGYAISLFERSYRYSKFKPCILIREYEKTRWGINILNSYFIDTDFRLHWNERNKIKRIVQEAFERKRLIPLHEILSANSYYDHLNNPNCLVRKKIEEMRNPNSKELILPYAEISRIWRREEVRDMDCGIRGNVLICHLLSDYKRDYIKTYIERNGIGKVELDNLAMKIIFKM